MADYKDILINFIADTKQFVGPINQAAGSINTFAGKLKNIKNLMMGAFVVHAVIRFTKHVLESTDALAEQARRLKVSVSDIDAYDLALQMGGQSIQEASKSLDFLNISLAKLSQNDPAKLKAFGNIGLDKEALAGKNYNDALELVAQQLGKVDEKARAVASREIFGRGGIKIYEGLKGLKEARAEIEEINRSLGITGDSVGDIEKIGDAFDLLKKKITIIGRAFASEFAPQVEDATDGATKAATYFGRFFRVLQHSGTVTATRGQNALAAAIHGIATIPIALFMQDDVINPINEANKAAKDAAEGGFSMFAKIFEKAELEMKKAQEAQEEYLEGLEKSAEKIKSDVKPSYDVYLESISRLDEMLKEEMITQKEYDLAAAKAHETLVKNNPDLARATQLTEQYKDEVEDLKSQMTELEQMNAVGMITDDVASRGIASLQEALDSLNPDIQAHNELLEQGKAATEKYAEGAATLRAEIENLKMLFDSDVIDEDTMTRGINQLNVALQELDPAFQKSRSELESFWQTLEAFAASQMEAAKSPFEKYEEHLAMLDMALAMGMVSWEAYAMSAINAAQAIDEALGLTGMQDMGGFGDMMGGMGGFQPPVMASPSRPGTAGMATASQIGGILAGSSSEDIGRKQLNEQQKMNTQLQQLVFNTTRLGIL